MSFWTYMLRCKDGHYYVGHTDALERRIAQHQHGGFCDYTSRRRPVTLVWSEQFSTRDEARTVERMLKGWDTREEGSAHSGRLADHFSACQATGGTSFDFAQDERGLMVSLTII